MVTRLQPGLTRAALNDDRWGHILDALCAANLHQVLSAVALKAVAVYAIPTPWLHQDTTTIRLYGAYEDEPKSPEASPEHPILWWGMKPTVSGKYPLDQHPEPRGASSRALHARESTDGNPPSYVGPTRSASFPTEVNNVVTRFALEGSCDHTL
jgi:hypothetical protein